MSVFEFSVSKSRGGKEDLTYYALTKNVKSYIRTTRHQYSKMDKSNLCASIHSIIGGEYGDYSYTEIDCIIDCEHKDGVYTEKKICGCELLKRCINMDPTCINKNKRNFCKKQYNAEYHRNKQFTRPPPTDTIGNLLLWCKEQQNRQGL